MTVGNTLTKPLTIDEFEELDLPEDREWELHHGELVGVTFPDLIHRRLQQRIVEILQSLFPDAEVLMEFPFQIKERLELRSADVGVAGPGRVPSAAETRLTGAPDFVVEALSPSNSLPKLKQYRRLCFESGTSVFWMVDPDDNTVDVYLKDQKLHRVWECGEEIPVALFGRQVGVRVDEIFRGITLPH